LFICELYDPNYGFPQETMNSITRYIAMNSITYSYPVHC